MSHPRRIEYANAFYHVMNRGVAKKTIFHNNYDRTIFLNMIGEMVKKFQIEVFAYCLMGNHYHLLIRTPDANLSKAIHFLDRMYSQRYNKLYRRDGHLFRGRFRSVLLEHPYVDRLAKYIHLNPVRAKMVKQPEHYHWSSYKVYLGLSAPIEWLNTNLILNKFNEKNPKEALRIFTEGGKDTELEAFFLKLKKPPIIGSGKFIYGAEEDYSEMVRQTPAMEEEKKRKEIKKVEQIVQVVAKHHHLAESVIFEAGKKRNIPRYFSIYLSSSLLEVEHRILARIFNVVPSGISQSNARFKECLENDKSLRDTAKILENECLAFR